jgi:hypothetical protein
METSTRPGRNVYGTDFVVTYSPRRDMVFVQEISCKEGDSGRFTPNALISTLGYTEEKDVYQFVKNNNLHYAGKGLRGALLLINNCIGLLVLSRGSYILFEVLLPCVLRGSYRIIDLRKRDRHFGFYLQQVRGDRLAVLQAKYRYKTREEGYPYMKEGYIYMYPGGPDFYIPGSNIPKEIMSEFKSLPENLCTHMHNNPSSRIKHLRKSKKTVSLYVADSCSRLSMDKQADCFYIPVGAEYGEKDCPWKRNDGSFGKYVQVLLFYVS